MPFLEPVLALCTDRSKLAKENPLLAGPDVWMPYVIAETDDLFSVSFDYFINWKTLQLDRDFWLKCPINLGKIPNLEELGDNEITNLLRRHERFKSLVKFSGANQAGASAVIFDDAQPWSQDSSTIIIASWPKDPISGRGLTINRCNVPQLKEIIKFKSGGPISIGDKKLFYGTSRLECHLSKTDALWPGDADLLICDRSSMRPIAIIEYKKHTESSKKTFKDQCIGNYYPYPDGRKYDRLELLAKQISRNPPIKFFTLYYSTIQSELDVKLEEVVGTYGNLKSGSHYTFNISPQHPEDGYKNVLTKIRMA